MRRFDKTLFGITLNYALNAAWTVKSELRFEQKMVFKKGLFSIYMPLHEKSTVGTFME